MPLERITPNRVRFLPVQDRCRGIFVGGGHGKLGKARHFAGFTFVDTFGGVKIFDLCGQLYFKISRIKAVIAPTAQRPALMFAQLSATVLPVGFTVPRPVITTRRFFSIHCTSHSHSTVNAKDLAGNVTGLLPCQKSHRRRNILGMADFACRMGLCCGTGWF